MLIFHVGMKKQLAAIGIGDGPVFFAIRPEGNSSGVINGQSHV